MNLKILIREDTVAVLAVTRKEEGDKADFSLTDATMVEVKKKFPESLKGNSML